MELSASALETLEKRYLLRDAAGKIIETPDELFDRVASAIADVEEDYEPWKRRFLHLMTNGDFLPNTPTLMNAGVDGGQLSACFVLPIEDSIDGIFETLKNSAKIHQTGGGTGFDFSRLRPTDSMVSSKQGVASGPISFARVYNAATEEMKQGGKRKGANMMNLRVDHPNIIDFINMKLRLNHKCETCGEQHDGVMTNFNVSVTVTNAFMEALKNDEQYDLVHPSTGRVESLYARDVWDLIAHNAWKSAEPGVIFIDRINEKSPYEERIEATNPCGEQPLPPYGACNLGSINISNFVEDREIDWDRLREVTQYSVRFLDNVIDANCYPIPEIAVQAQKYRNIGLGPMGWADALIKLKIPYDSPQALEMAWDVMRFINETAHNYSVQLGKEKGLPEGAPFKTFFDYSSSDRRNATLTNSAPTGSLCIIFNVSSGIEPNFGFAMDQHIMDTVLTRYHPLYEAAKNNGGVDSSIFVESHQIDVKYHVDMQAAFQENADAAISKTANLHRDATVEDVKQTYMRAWETGCKGITVYRDGSREGTLHMRDEPKTGEGYCPDCGNELINESGCETCLNCHWTACAIA